MDYASISNIEKVNMADGEIQALNLTISDVFVSGGLSISNTFFIDGDSSDIVEI